MTTNKLDVPEIQYRSMTFERAGLDAETRTLELTFSSETDAVTRYFGVEVLGHGSSEINLERLNSGNHPLCIDHKTDIASGQIGVIEKAWVKGKRGHALVRFGRGPLAEEILQRVLDEELKNVSVGYRTHETTLIKKGEGDEAAEYRVTSWTPYEISIVSVAADVTVGLDRSDANISIPIIGDKTMSRKKDDNNVVDDDNQNRQQGGVVNPPAASLPAQLRTEDQPKPEDVRTEERQRMAAIQTLGRDFGIASDKVDAAVSNGTSVDDFRQVVLDDMKETSRSTDPTAGTRGNIGMTDGEVRDYSFMKAVRAMLNPNDKRAQDAAAFEHGCSVAAADQRGQDTNGMIVPMDVLRAPIPTIGHNSRAMTVGSAGEAGNLVATNLMPSYIDLLYNKMMVRALGATTFNDLTGNVDFKKFVSGASSYWVGEGGEVGEGTPGTDLIQMSPNTVGGWVELTRRTLIQSSMDIEAWVRRDLATSVALAIDDKALHGDGAGNTPVGLVNLSGIGAVAHGTNGGATSWGKVVDFETEVADNNADVESMGYLINSRTRGNLKQIEKSSGGDFIMDAKRDASGFYDLNGYRAAVSNQVASNLTKGTGTNLSEMFFGNWSDLFLGFWTGLDLMANPYAHDKSGTVRITALQDVDVAFARAESFSYANDINTAA